MNCVYHFCGATFVDRISASCHINKGGGGRAPYVSDGDKFQSRVSLQSLDAARGEGGDAAPVAANIFKEVKHDEVCLLVAEIAALHMLHWNWQKSPRSLHSTRPDISAAAKKLLSLKTETLLTGCTKCLE